MRALLSLWLVLLAGVGQAHAGRPCDTSLPKTGDVVRGIALAERTARALDASGADVVVLARAGQDLSQHGLRWSHLAFAYRLSPPAPPTADEPAPRFVRSSFQPAVDAAPGTWRVVHKLNHCGSDHAALYRQGLAEFFLDSPHRYEAAYAVLAPALQARLLPLLQDNRAVARWHERRYNLVAYPWATRYQQSNQWLLETLAGALICPQLRAQPAPPPEGDQQAWRGPALACEPGATNRQRAQAWLQFQGYEPTRLRIGALTRLGARVSRANVAFDDHPNHLRFADRIDTVGADSVFAWLPRAGLAEAERLVR